MPQEAFGALVAHVVPYLSARDGARLIADLGVSR
jgi:hypothetical protein